MEGIVWFLLALIVALVVPGIVLVGLRRRSLSIKFGSCPSCSTPMSLRRVSLFQSLTMQGMWMCPHCGTRMSKAGKRAGAAT